ncbi:helix-turn-helix domain-containing protein [Arenibacter sp. GZD96]|uniref:helix-turn-helix domain-containing protein n=1 Tax=Aurantibrevibacter litoralis TaxID=3106030 RepID=UPI002AFFB599|nr:helix-turn-helix domain-containing protein [Arenibacter sp. GZD-96]MEA1784734.1 helix-turn-helix domain-containing protein [Arenibacter sp. GZD-96]
MSGSIQFVNLDPEEFISELDKRSEKRLAEMAKHFEPKKPTEYLTRSEVAALLKVNVSSVHNYTKRNLLVAYGLAGSVLYKRSEVEAALIQLKK